MCVCLDVCLSFPDVFVSFLNVCVSFSGCLCEFFWLFVWVCLMVLFIHLAVFASLS